ncbi:MAG: hypothetical protein L7F78_25495 [Syntrophales bacterium LBB04]|nr:hypothetical protein [Syntrophales bacterium LBB04]
MAMLNGVLRDSLKVMLPGNVLFDEPLSRYTSIGMGGEADAIVFPKTREELINTLLYLKGRGRP